MFIACPHCRYLVATDPRGQRPPQRCTRCGGALTDAAAATTTATGDGAAAETEHSFARLLRRDEPAPIDAEESTISPAIETIVDNDGDAAPSTQGHVTQEHDAGEEDAAPASFEATPPGEATRTTDPADTATPLAASTHTAPAAPSHRTRAPSFLHGASAQRPSRTPGWQWASLTVLALLLVLQVLLADRGRLAGDAAWRPLLTSLCGTLGCSLPPWREPQAFAMLDRDVRPAAAPGILHARATFRNEARWPQPWPVLMLTLKDADGRTLGARALTPADYLRGQNASAEIGPGQSAQVAVHLREPSANVVAFSFDFR